MGDVEIQGLMGYLKRVLLGQEHCGPFQQRMLREFISNRNLRHAQQTLFTETLCCSYDQGEPSCPICMSEFKVGENIFCFPRCGHIFHSTCFLVLLADINCRCPCCRSPFIDSLISAATLGTVRQRRQPNSEAGIISRAFKYLFS